MTPNDLLQDLLETLFSKSKIILPHSIAVLDIGAGRWEYSPMLVDFLRKYGIKAQEGGERGGKGEAGGKRGRNVRLVGIDPLGDQLSPRVPKGAEYRPIEVFQLDDQEEYDIIFLIHPFPDYRLKEHGLPIYPPDKLFTKILSLLKRRGYFVGIAYGAPPEEYELFNQFPKNNILLIERYTNEEATRLDYELGKDTYHNNMVLIGRK